MKPLLKRLIALLLLTLTAMTLFRLFLYFRFLPPDTPPVSITDIAKLLFFGARLDLSTLAYLFLPPLLALLAAPSAPGPVRRGGLRIYFFIALSLLGAILFADAAYFSFFGGHMTLTIFGVFDDDTRALWAIARKNYPVFSIIAVAAFFLSLLWIGLGRLFDVPSKPKENRAKTRLLLLALILLDLAALRGSLGKYPIYRWSEDVVADRYANQISKSAFYAFVRAVKQYRKSKSGHADYAKRVGWRGTTAAAYAAVAEHPCPKATLACLRRVTPPNPAAKRLRPHVVVIMAESFGTPILRYQSPDFDIMGRLKPHFEKDILFTRFISTANGTIASMEPTLLNLTALPGSTPYGQGPCQTRTFPTAAAIVYQKAGYETTFLYGGDLSWRNVGNFFARQGFEHVEGRAKIGAALHLDPKDYHDWGVYDQFLYRYILRKLQKAQKPQ
ncbi:MAG: sulfatase-like hydrolase/transferase, partial [Epsilonproteobacteria bacterium]|nr:sulfatase-like hydrolase/transferase [Campylobacterota bacterium]